MPDGCAYTVISSVSASDYQHMLILCRYAASVLQPGIQQALGGGFQKIYCKVYACAVPARHINIPWVGGPAGQDDAVKFLPYFVDPVIPAHIRSRHKGDAFLLHHIHFAVNNPFFQLHVGYSVHQQAAHTIVPLKYSDTVPPFIQLVRSSQACGTGSDNRHLFAGADGGRIWEGISAVVCLFDDGPLIFLHGHRIPVQAAGTGRLAGGRAYPGGELREAVGFLKTVVGLFPVAGIHQVVPFRHQIVQRASADHTANRHA